MRVLRTIKRLPKETVSWEAFSGLDGQGSPSYASPVELEAKVFPYDTTMRGQGERFVVMENGSRIETPLTLYIDGESESVPGEQDRITIDSDRSFIVVEKQVASRLDYSRFEPSHYRLRCRVE